MLAGTLQTWITRRISVRQRLERVCTSYLLFLMVAATKHSLEEAARFSGLHNPTASFNSLSNVLVLKGMVTARSWLT
jgi:hypothetical protein